MIKDPRNWPKLVHTELATLIYGCHDRGRLSAGEMLCLLEVLELVMQPGDNQALLSSLHRWAQVGLDDKEDQEINQIIKETLIGVDWKEPAQLARCAELISELAAELEKIKQG